MREHVRIKKRNKKGRKNRARTKYPTEFKAKIVLQVLQGEQELGEICAENKLNPNMGRNWKKKFLEKASSVFVDPKKAEKESRREEERLKKQNDQMLKTIGQLTLERDFLQGCFRRTGKPVPTFGTVEE